MSTPIPGNRETVPLTDGAAHWLDQCREILKMGDAEIIELAVVSLGILLVALSTSAMKPKAPRSSGDDDAA
jgi:hypothetical protein